MDQYGDDHYDPDAASATDGSVIGTTIRNVAVLVAACLALAWILNDFSGFAEQGVTPPFNTAQDGDDPAEDADTEPANENLAQGHSEIVIPPGPRGHFIVVAEVNGVDVQFLVDTGASSVTLTEDDARRVGLLPHTLDYTAVYRTANGDISVAPVSLRQMRIQGLEVAGVDGTVTRAPLHISLLGMSFLSRLAGYEVRGDGLVMRY